MKFIFPAHARLRLWTVFKRLAAFDSAKPLVILLTFQFWAGCGKEDVRVYRVAKETPPPPEASTPDLSQMPPGHPDIADNSRPRLSWKLPSNWEELPAGGMRVASFMAKGA